MSVWITRSAPDNMRTARGLRALGQRPLMVPVLTMMARYQPTIMSLPDAIIFTSVHAVRHFARYDWLSTIPVFAAAGTVAHAASIAGYVTVIGTGGNDAMLSHIIGHVLPPDSRILLLCGDSASSLVADRLTHQGFRVTRQAVYKAIAIQEDALAHVIGALRQVSAVVVHSRSGAERVVPMLRSAQWSGSLWCISDQAASVCSDLQHVEVHIAADPSERALFDMIARISPPTPNRRSPARGMNAALLSSTLQPRRRAQDLTALNDNGLEYRSDDDPDSTAA